MSKKLAVIQTGGKQYLVEPGQVLKIEKLDGAKEGLPTGQAGGVVSFDKVLLTIDGSEVKIGKPNVEGASVSATVKKEGRADKIVVLKYKAKTRHRVKRGHRQPFTEVTIGEIK